MLKELPPEIGVYGRQVLIETDEDEEEWLNSESPPPAHVFAIMFFDGLGRHGSGPSWIEGEIRNLWGNGFYTAYSDLGYAKYVGYYVAQRLGLVKLSGTFARKRYVNGDRGFEESWLWRASECTLIAWIKEIVC